MEGEMPIDMNKNHLNFNEILIGGIMTKDRPKQSLFSYMTHNFDMLWFIMALGMGGPLSPGLHF